MDGAELLIKRETLYSKDNSKMDNSTDMCDIMTLGLMFGLTMRENAKTANLLDYFER